jgi:lipopolysaccharide/colanic/teichoic acid biosynthesis glycosyltransferase
MYKIRSMCADAEQQRSSLLALNERDGALFKMESDPRVTRVGRLLRKSSLDELPQLWNVVRGDMSLIGPRPALPEEVQQYDDVARRRLAVKPGLTGLSQVNGRASLSYDNTIQLDVFYTDNWRLADDIAIGANTVRAVISAKGAY